MASDVPQPTRERDLLLATKLHTPRVRADLLVRSRLVQRLLAVRDARLILLSAPPGFGKSTLLADWARRAPEPIAWVSLDPDDNDPVRFWRHVTAALERVHPGLGERVEREGVDPPEWALQPIPEVTVVGPPIVRSIASSSNTSEDGLRARLSHGPAPTR